MADSLIVFHSKLQNDTGRCDVCGKGRGHGKHLRCTQIRKAWYDAHPNERHVKPRPNVIKAFADGWLKHSKTRQVR